MRACLDAWQKADEKLCKTCAAAGLEHEFIGDHYPMQMVVRSKDDEGQLQMDGVAEEQKVLEAVYMYDGSNIWWKFCTDAEITNDLHNKIVSAFKSLCNAYAHYRYSEYLEGR